MKKKAEYLIKYDKTLGKKCIRFKTPHALPFIYGVECIIIHRCLCLPQLHQDHWFLHRLIPLCLSLHHRATSSIIWLLQGKDTCETFFDLVTLTFDLRP